MYFILDIEKEYKYWTDVFVKESKDYLPLSREKKENGKEILRKNSDIYEEATEYKDDINAEYRRSKILETYFEAAPQSILQLYIIFTSYGFSNNSFMQWVSFLTSFLNAANTAISIYSEFPSKVNE